MNATVYYQQLISYLGQLKNELPSLKIQDAQEQSLVQICNQIIQIAQEQLRFLEHDEN